MNHFRIAILGVTAAAVAFAAPGLAKDRPATKQVEKHVEIIHADHKDGAGKDGDKKIVKRHVIVDGESSERAALMAKCGDRRFESVAVSGTEQDKRQTKIKLCAAKGESNAQWAKTLNDALARLEANQDMPPENKAKIVAELKAEIAKFN